MVVMATIQPRDIGGWEWTNHSRHFCNNNNTRNASL